MSFLFLNNNREEEGKTHPYWVSGTSLSREDIRKRCRKVSMVEILCTHHRNGKIRPIDYSGMGGDKGE
jgi:hypothetical protein